MNHPSYLRSLKNTYSAEILGYVRAAFAHHPRGPYLPSSCTLRNLSSDLCLGPIRFRIWFLLDRDSVALLLCRNSGAFALRPVAGFPLVQLLLSSRLSHETTRPRNEHGDQVTQSLNRGWRDVCRASLSGRLRRAGGGC